MYEFSMSLGRKACEVVHQCEQRLFSLMMRDVVFLMIALVMLATCFMLSHPIFSVDLLVGIMVCLLVSIVRNYRTWNSIQRGFSDE